MRHRAGLVLSGAFLLLSLFLPAQADTVRIATFNTEKIVY